MSDGLLMAQLAGFLVYEAACGETCFADWADERKFAAGDRTFLEVAYMAVEVLPGLGA
jgi:hypothetical protein